MKRFLGVAVAAVVLAGVWAQVGAQPEGIHCKVNGNLAFCAYNTNSDTSKCMKIENQYSNETKTCAELLAACTSRGAGGGWGTIYSSPTSPSVINDPPYGAGEKCNALTGFTCVAGTDCPTTIPEMCLYSSGNCYAIPANDAAEKANCLANGWIYNGGREGDGTYCLPGGTFTGQGKNNNPPTGPSVGPKKYCNFGACVGSINNGYGCETGGCYELTGDDVCGEGGTEVDVCPAGTLPPALTGVKLLANKAATPGLKVSYAKNRVTVNWTPTTKIANGTVQLLNAKGVALSTSYIKANSNKVTAKLGTVGVPAGMYFVHISAVGVNGQKIVTQSAVSIVK